MGFQAGEQWNGNAKGRRPGSKNKIGRDFQLAYEEAKERYKHPYLLMMEWAHDESKPLEVRAAMIKEAASYTCTKPKITVRSEVPVLTSIEQAEAFLAALAAENDFDPIELMTVVRHWIDSRRAGQELQMKQIAQNQDTGPRDIHITGGLPALPGCDVIMPKRHEATGQDIEVHHNGHTLDLEKNEGSTLPAPAVDGSEPQAKDTQP